MNPDGTIAPLTPQTVAETRHHIPIPPDPYSIPSNAPWISVPINPTSTFLTFAGPSHNLGAETSQHFLANPTTNSINQIPQYGNIAPSADYFNNPDVLENLPMEGTPRGTIDPRLLWVQSTQPILTHTITDH